ncbi:hypothetical protein NL676_038453 [Syzygium grande]|nr:hypothetical protein NL676_038453 [Syzygium grande]
MPLSFTLRGNDPAATRCCCFKSSPVALAVTSLAKSRSSSPASNFVDIFANEVTGLLFHLHRGYTWLPDVCYTIINTLSSWVH